MGRSTIDFGIDLGTTHPEIALMDQGRVRVFKNVDQRESTPSVVRIDRRGTVHVGHRAYERLGEDPENTATEFKRLMGSSHSFTFAASGRTLTPEELSAEVLKSLKADAARAGFECQATVITVPAYFEIVQCEATQRAAKITGLVEAPLLQEPIAAAISYGKDQLPRDGYWVVYDLGGGTFDVAIIKRTGGHLGVVDCGGNNFLGGKDFDWLVVERTFIPALTQNFDIPSLARGNQQHRILIAKLKKEAEAAKIALTDSDEVTVYLEGCGVDRRDRPIELAIPIRRRDYERLIEPLIAETVALCKQILDRARLTPGAVDRVILVGGSTMTPAVREAIRNTLNVQVESRIDPITVVAQGAAIFASSQPFPHTHQIPSPGKLLVQLSFAALCEQPTTMVAGRIRAQGNEGLLADLRARLIRDDQGWQSGFLPVKEGAFVCQVSLREHQTNTYRLTLFDGTGRPLPVEPDTLCITHGLSVANPPIQRTIGVEVITEQQEGRYDPLLARGTPLPAKATRTFRAARSLAPGSTDQVLNIHVYEGEHENPEHNLHLGTLTITGRQVRRAVPVNAEIEVTLTIDASRIPTAHAHIPILGETFREILKDTITPRPDPDRLATELERIKMNWQLLKERGTVPAEAAARIDHQVTQAKVDMAAAMGDDPGALEKADRLIRELQAALANASKAEEVPQLLESLEEARENARDVVQKYGIAADHEQLRGLEADASRALAKKDARLCRTATERLWNLYWRVLFQQDGFWVGVFQDLTEQGRFTDPARAQALMVEGSRLLQTHDIARFREVTQQLWNLVPKQIQQETARRVSDAGIKH